MSDAAEPQVVEGAGEPKGEIVPAAAPSRAEVLRPLDVAQVKEQMQVYQRGLHELLDPSDWQGPPGQDGSFVKKSGWRKIATWFSLSVSLTADEVERDEDGLAIRAKCWARATAPNGRSADGDGYCSLDEPRFTRKGGEPIPNARLKVEHDLRSTAATRAMNRAVSNLVGMGDLSAEEADPQPPPSSSAGERCTQEQARSIGSLLSSSPISKDARAKFNEWAARNLTAADAGALIATLNEDLEKGADMAARMAGYSDLPLDEDA